MYAVNMHNTHNQLDKLLQIMQTSLIKMSTPPPFCTLKLMQNYLGNS